MLSMRTWRGKDIKVQLKQVKFQPYFNILKMKFAMELTR